MKRYKVGSLEEYYSFFTEWLNNKNLILTVENHRKLYLQFPTSPTN